MRIFAVRMGDYVEFRSASRPPRAKVSKLTRVVVVPNGYYDYYGDQYVTLQSVNTKVTLKTVFYVGGRVLGVMKRSVYVSHRLPRLGKRGIIEVPKTVKTLLKGV